MTKNIDLDPNEYKVLGETPVFSKPVKKNSEWLLIGSLTAGFLVVVGLVANNWMERFKDVSPPARVNDEINLIIDCDKAGGEAQPARGGGFTCVFK